MMLLQQTSNPDVKLLKLLDLSDMMPQNSWSSLTVSNITVDFAKANSSSFESDGLLYH